MNRILTAARLASEWHAGQFRKYTNDPYIVHPARVATSVMLLHLPWLTAELHETMVCAAWAHDLKEDTAITVEQLDASLGPDVTRLVLELTNPSKGSPLPRATRKAMDREHIRQVSRPAKIIKLIDRCDNLREIRQAPEDFIALYRQESRALLEVLRGTHEDLEATMQKLIDG